MSKIYNVLFLCTHNSARSIMCEAYLNANSKGRFRAFSAGSFPSGSINPFTLETLKIAGLPASRLSSKSWDMFAKEGAPEIDFVITVCDRAVGETCPVWLGHPITAHWSFPDPSSFEGGKLEKHAFFLDVFRQIRARIDVFVALPIEALDRLALKQRLDAIGRDLSKTA